MDPSSEEAVGMPSESQAVEDMAENTFAIEEASKSQAVEDIAKEMSGIIPSNSQVYDGSMGDLGASAYDDEEGEGGPDEQITFEDLFGSEFDETQFAEKDVRVSDLKKLDNETKNTVSRLEEENHVKDELLAAFGDTQETQNLLNLTEDVPITDMEAVHAVNVLSAPDGIKLNPHASRNKFFPTAATCFGNMPVLDNFQCLHLPLSDRKISTTEAMSVPNDRKPIQAGLQGAGQTYPGALYSPQNVIRWRKKRGVQQSNARLMEYDNGDRILRVGTDYFVVESADAAQENLHLMGVHGPVLMQYVKLRKRWRIRPLRVVNGVKNSTLDEKLRKERENTMPTAPVKEVKPYITPRDVDRKEERFEALYTEFESDAKGQADVEAENVDVDVDDDDIIEIRSVAAASDAGSEGGKRALAIQAGEDEMEVTREVKKRKTQ